MDKNGDNIIWLENAEGECEAYLLDNRNMTIMPYESCEIALETWKQCVAADACIDPATNI
jgi:hypothetical protein